MKLLPRPVLCNPADYHNRRADERSLEEQKIGLSYPILVKITQLVCKHCNRCNQ
jgi:hypothetical protein